ncbi:DUF2092 domain-containing protein [Xanthobacter sp. V4C-4]|uniref:DUF2092 domain-containing protein n=1 Tax=Xanthobacter cornucopiae TaxID=3119924 RepID=UPI003726665A
MLHPKGLFLTVAALSVTALVAGAGAPRALAAPPASQPTSPAAPLPLEDRAATTIDPAAVAALTRMGETLAALNSFELTARTTVEVTLKDEHQVQIGGVVHYWVKRPDRVRIDSETDTLSRQYFFDGKTFTLVAPNDRYFAQTEGRGTIRDTLAFAAQALDIEVPLADLFDWGTAEAPLKQFERGFYVGTAKIDGTTTEHYALIGKDFDFEIWIQQGDVPLPLKLSLVDHRAAAGPRFTATLSWRPDAAIPDDIFTFVPSKDVARIRFAKPASTPGSIPPVPPAPASKGAQ